jgi:hypothetical protein
VTFKQPDPHSPQFTPGPWTIGDRIEEADDGGSSVEIDAKDARWLALATVCVRMELDPLDSRAGTANAHLIAAAPDLYAALERIAAYDDVSANEQLAATGSYSAFDEPGSVRIARAALERARGEVKP